MKTKDRLLDALAQAGAPVFMLERAARGGYDDYECEESATPCVDLYNDARKSGLTELAERCLNGEFDGTKEEADAWWQSKGHKLIPGLDLTRGSKPK